MQKSSPKKSEMVDQVIVHVVFSMMYSSWCSPPDEYLLLVETLSINSEVECTKEQRP